MSATIGSMAHDRAWQQEERQDAEPIGKLCGGCGEELTAADIEYGAEDSEVDPCGYGYEAFFPICIKCAKGEPTCHLCNAPLTEADEQQGATMFDDSEAQSPDECWFPICIPCSRKDGSTIWIPKR